MEQRQEKERERDREPSQEEIRALLQRRRPREVDPGDLKLAAVLVPLFMKEGRWHVLLTRRTNTVEHHKGEISFPGGHRDPEDKDFLSTALRETEEEVGIPRESVRVLGRLDDYVTITGFRIRPFVGVIPYPFVTRVSPEEIAEVLLVPLKEFMLPGRMRTEEFTRNGSSFPVYFFSVEGQVVWGATARILKSFLELVYGFRAS